MKIRLRPMDSKETLKLDLPTPTSLDHLKSLIAVHVSASPSSLHLSLNRRDDLPSHLSVTSGDLLFYTSSPLGFYNSPPSLVSGAERTVATVGNEPERPAPTVVNEPERPVATVANEPPPVPVTISGFLYRPFSSEIMLPKGTPAVLIDVVHAIFLESGFIAVPSFPNSNSPVITAEYNVPFAEVPVKLTVSVVANFANFYGSMNGSAEVYHVSLDSGRFMPAIEKGDIVEIFDMWKSVKDGLCLPLLIDTCERNGLPLPPCFARLPTELKLSILERLPAIDLARMGCVSSELRYLSSNDDLWVKKIIEVFGYVDGKGMFGERWKDQFVMCWNKRKLGSAAVLHPAGHRFPRLPPFWDRRVPFPLSGFNVIGGNYDRFPAIGGRFGTGFPDQGFLHNNARRSFSPNCNFGSYNR